MQLFWMMLFSFFFMFIVNLATKMIIGRLYPVSSMRPQMPIQGWEGWTATKGKNPTSPYMAATSIQQACQWTHILTIILPIFALLTCYKNSEIQMYFNHFNLYYTWMQLWWHLNTQLRLHMIYITSGAQLVHQRLWCVLFCLWESAFKRSLAAYWKE